MEEWFGDWFGPWWGEGAESSPPPAGTSLIRFRGTVQEMLEAATALCCCGSGSGSGVQRYIPWSCCPGRLFPDTIHATHSGTQGLNGTWPLHYSATNPWPWVPGGTWGSLHPGYFSDAIYRFTCPGAFGAPDQDVYAFLYWSLLCSYVWFEIRLAGGVWGGASLVLRGRNAGACDFDFSCDPFYFRGGLYTVASDPGTPAYTCSLFEPAHTCGFAGTGSPIVEISE